MKQTKVVVPVMIASMVAGASLALWMRDDDSPPQRYVSKESIEQIYDPCVKVRNTIKLAEEVDGETQKSWFGSGVLLEGLQKMDFYVLSAEHITADEYYILREEQKKLVRKQRKIPVLESKITIENYLATTLKEDEDADLALFSVEGNISLQPYKGKVAHKLYAYDFLIGTGFPNGEKKYFVSSIEKIQTDIVLLNTTLIGGNSGGGVYRLNNGTLELAGVVSKVQGMTSLEKLRQFLKGTSVEHYLE